MNLRYNAYMIVELVDSEDENLLPPRIRGPLYTRQGYLANRESNFDVTFDEPAFTKVKFK